MNKHMNHELIKELKDAGFPLVEMERDQFSVLGRVYIETEPEAEDKWGKIKYYRIPTLSELINACPRGKYCKTWDYDCDFCLKSSPDGWIAFYEWMDGVGHAELDNDTEYPTKEEAVARLWLAINKK
jgi:hypothetical protein